VPWGTVARGFLAGRFGEGTRFGSDDNRASVPRLQGDALKANMALFNLVRDWAAWKGITQARSPSPGSSRRSPSSSPSPAPPTPITSPRASARSTSSSHCAPAGKKVSPRAKLAISSADGHLIDRHRDQIVGVLSCYDRVVIRRTLPSVCHAQAMATTLDARGLAFASADQRDYGVRAALV